MSRIKYRRRWNKFENDIFFAVNYLMASGLFGNTFEAIGGPELLPLLWDLSKTHSWAEVRARIRLKHHMWFGDEYAYILLHFTVTVALGISSPMITPFGVLYLVLKHAIDSRRLRTRALTTSVSVEFHALAIGFVVGSTLLLQFYNALFFNVRIKGEEREPTAVVACFLALLTGAVFMLEVDSGWTWPLRVLPERGRRRVAAGPAAAAREATVYKPEIHHDGEDFYSGRSATTTTESDLKSHLTRRDRRLFRFPARAKKIKVQL